MKYKIPFNRPHLTRKELAYIKHANSLGWLSGGGFYTKKCNKWLEKKLGTKKAFLTHSCTAALEMEAILSDVGPRDEVIMPSYTFVSSANAFVLRRATPVFVDIREDTLNINEKLIEGAITKKTKVIMVVHYAGVGCEMDTVNRIAKKHRLLVVEDAAQGILAKYRGRYLGTIGHLGALSFHETKNVISGEGGALLVNDNRFVKRAEIVREKGTNRSAFLRGEVDKYSWVDIGSSYLPSEIIASFLMAQLERSTEITKKRKEIWSKYHRGLGELEEKGYLRRPIIPEWCEHNAHTYYILTKNLKIREKLIAFLKKRSILAVSHYVPLHSSKGGKKYARYAGRMETTNKIAKTLVRLPLFYDITGSEVDYVIRSIDDFFKK